MDGGGAVYGFGGGETVIVGSTFTGNSASNGDAVGSLNGDLVVVNSVFTGNAASGSGGNPGRTTETLVPAPESPALGRGRGCPPTDQRGRPRAEACTAGAVEVP